MSSATDLADFEVSLREQMGELAIRPFVCEGSPLDCQIAIIGFNPATQENDPFWKFWKTGYGFDKAQWLETYKATRRARNGQEGRRVQELSNTRRVIEWITADAMPARCLETNLYPTATRTAAELSADKRDATLLEFLLDRVQPRILLAHGKDASAHLGQFHEDRIVFELAAMRPNEAVRALQAKLVSTRSEIDRWLVTVPHFSRGWSQEGAGALGRLLRDAVVGWVDGRTAAP